MSEQTDQSRGDIEMHRREITISDGRYLYFYTFGEGADAPASETGSNESPETTEERDV